MVTAMGPDTLAAAMPVAASATLELKAVAGALSAAASALAMAAADAALEITDPAAMAQLTASVASAGSVPAPERIGQLDAYVLAQSASGPFDMAQAVGWTASALTSALAELSALPGGAALATALTVGIEAQSLAQASVREASADIAAKIDAALATKASLDVQASAGVSGPNINLTAIAKKVGRLKARKAALDAVRVLGEDLLVKLEQLNSLTSSIKANLDATGLIAYRFDGNLALAGVELQAQIQADLQGSGELSGVAGNGHFVVMLPTNPGAWGALQATVRTS